MISSLRKPIGILVALVMLAALFMMPATAQARIFLASGDDHGSGGGDTEGDPLDSNDYSSGGGGSSHEQRINPGDSDLLILEIMNSSQTIILRIDYISGVPIFRIHVLSDSELGLEGKHDR